MVAGVNNIYRRAKLQFGPYAMRLGEDLRPKTMAERYVRATYAGDAEAFKQLQSLMLRKGHRTNTYATNILFELSKTDLRPVDEKIVKLRIEALIFTSSSSLLCLVRYAEKAAKSALRALEHM